MDGPWGLSTRLHPGSAAPPPIPRTATGVAAFCGVALWASCDSCGPSMLWYWLRRSLAVLPSAHACTISLHSGRASLFLEVGEAMNAVLLFDPSVDGPVIVVIEAVAADLFTHQMPNLMSVLIYDFNHVESHSTDNIWFICITTVLSTRLQ